MSLFILAGPNGAGKSSVVGATLVVAGTTWFNPDTEAARLRALDPTLSVESANGQAWAEGKRLLESAVRAGWDLALETTLGGNTIPELLLSAARAGTEVRMWFVALSSPELHIERVHSRVVWGGHNIPEAKVRERYDRSRANLLMLLPHLTELRVFDNSRSDDPEAGGEPRPLPILHLEDGRIVYLCPLDETPDWAKHIVMAALKLFPRP